MDKNNYDFCGWATRANVKCADGRTILPGAFSDMDGKTVPLVWNHGHTDVKDVIGHALLKVRPEGVYTYGKFNNSREAEDMKIRVDNGDINSMSIYANQVKQNAGNVTHGVIREVSLVLAGANPGAYIETVFQHSDGSYNNEDEALIFSGDEISMTDELNIQHADDSTTDTNSGNSSDKTVADVIDSMTEEQKNVMYYIIGTLVENSDNNDEGGTEDMKHNVFDSETANTEDTELVHSALAEIISDAKGEGRSMKRVFNEYLEANSDNADAIMHAATYGVDPVDYLFPEARTLSTTPEFIKRDTTWVSTFMNSVHHTPFSRIKSMFADLREDEARARGYIKGKKKVEEVFTLLKRTTTPTTIYKKQKMDRDDIVDITDFDVIAWLKSEMRMMLDEEIARAILVGDGRLASSDDKINESNIRPIWTDDELYTIKTLVTLASDGTGEIQIGEDDDTAELYELKDADRGTAFIDACIRSRKEYKGSGNPTLYTTEDMVTDMLLLKDRLGHYMYKSTAELATVLRVARIETVEVMEGLSRTVGSDKHELAGIIVNPTDYNVGADKGGAVSMFDDFDIDYNQQKYLIETRCSGALTKPFSAIAIEFGPATTVATPPSGD